MAHALVALDEVSRVSDQELITRLSRLVRADRGLQDRLLVHIGEVDARGLYRERAYSSMFAYCVEELRMSDDQAYLRIQAARLGRKFPRILEMIADGVLHLTAIKLLGPHFTADNHVDLLERACGRRKREVALLVAEIAPKPDVPSRTRKLPEPRSARATRPEALPTSVEAKQASSVARQSLFALPEACEPNNGPFDRAGESNYKPFGPTNEANRAPFDRVNPNRAPFDRADDSNREPFNHADQANREPFNHAGEGNRAPFDRAGERNREAFNHAGEGNREPFERAGERNREPFKHAGEGNRAPFDRAGDAHRESFERCGGTHRETFALEAPRRRSSSTPLSPGRYKVVFTAGQALHDKLAQLKDLLRHQVPDGELAVIVERAVDLLIDETMKQRFAQTRAAKKPHAAERLPGAPDAIRSNAVTPEALSLESPTGGPRRPRVANSRYIPRAVVREVYQRDGGQCTFVSSEGKRCSERGFLELHHHDRPYARGGQATVENMRLVCRSHNSLFAERDFGRAFMRSKLKHTREPSNKLAPDTCHPNLRELST